MSETVTVNLKKPITQGEGEKAVTLTKLSFHEATVGDLCRADAAQGEMMKTIAVLSGMAGVDIPTMQKLGATDFNAILAEVGTLMGEHIEEAGTGTTSS